MTLNVYFTQSCGNIGYNCMILCYIVMITMYNWILLLLLLMKLYRSISRLYKDCFFKLDVSVSIVYAQYKQYYILSTIKYTYYYIDTNILLNTIITNNLIYTIHSDPLPISYQ